MAVDKESIEIRKKVAGFKKEDKTPLTFPTVKTSIELIQGVQLPEREFITTKAINPKRIIKIAQKDLNTLFPKLNKNTLYLSKSESEALAMKHIQSKTPEVRVVTDFNLHAKQIDIFSIPLNYMMQQKRGAYTILSTLIPYDQSLLDLVKSTISQIDVSGPADYLTAVMYEHELIHALLRNYKGIIEDYYHEEVLPIFIEKVISLEADSTEELNKKSETYRMRSHQDDIRLVTNDEDFLDEGAHKHLISGLLANLMFYRYYNETSIGRRHMLDEVQKVLNGEKTVEEFLLEQDISLQSSELIEATKHSINKCLVK